MTSGRSTYCLRNPFDYGCGVSNLCRVPFFDETRSFVTIGVGSDSTSSRDTPLYSQTPRPTSLLTRSTVTSLCAPTPNFRVSGSLGIETLPRRLPLLPSGFGSTWEQTRWSSNLSCSDNEVTKDLIDV